MIFNHKGIGYSITRCLGETHLVIGTGIPGQNIMVELLKKDYHSEAINYINQNYQQLEKYKIKN